MLQEAVLDSATTAGLVASESIAPASPDAGAHYGEKAMKSEADHSIRRPEIVGIEITRACNLHCAHCFTAAGRRPARELSTVELRNVIDQLADLGPVRAIGWTGGEPLLRADLVELVAYAYQRSKMRSGITTNGLLLESDLAKRLRDSGAYAIQISVDGSTADRFAQIRGGRIEDFATILKAMESVRRAGMQLHLAMLLGKETLADARDFLRLAADCGADGVRFCGFVPAGRGQHDAVRERFEFADNLKELREFIAEAVALPKPLIMFDPAFGPLPPDYRFHECVAGKQTMYLAANGAVYPCTSLIAPRFEIGNVRSRSLSDMWHDRRMTEIADFDCGGLKGHCNICEHLSACHSGCRGIAYANTGDITASCPSCLYHNEVATLGAPNVSSVN